MRQAVFLSLLISGAAPLFAHIADEIAVKTTITVNQDTVVFSLDISSGILFSTAFLKMLDPDHDKIFAPNDQRAFSDFVQNTFCILVNGDAVAATPIGFSASAWDFFAAGISTIILDYEVPLAVPETGETSVNYLISLYPEVAIYTLFIKNDASETVLITDETRNEFLQDEVTLRITGDPVLIAAAADQTCAQTVDMPTAPLPKEKKTLVRHVTDFVRSGFEITGILASVQNTALDRSALYLMLALAVIVGFFHAFTPGHGKALVGAFLIANQGTLVHAFFLGLVITLSHTASIYIFGLLTSTAAVFFLPGEFIPLLSVGCGVCIVILGLYGFIRRLLGKEIDHAHLIPNLQVLKKNMVNILIDGSAAAANEALLIASEDAYIQNVLHAAGAADFNLCSPGCSAHRMMPARIRQRQNSEFFKYAVKTGAIDGVVTASEKTRRHLGKLADKTHVAHCNAVTEKPLDFLFRTLDTFSHRGDIVMPESTLSWRRVISLGIAGGIVPCPDALAVLLVAVAAGKIYLGMGIIVLFSMGLAFALIAIGTIIVLTKRVMARQKKLAAIMNVVPYVSSLFVSFLGLLMIRSAV
ncbi:MAG: sulfite exporter TauE/SafE family protein [Treponema sp.]|nr:sulfite exporter TauE/SafE family protein [Treponema sp.]